MHPAPSIIVFTTLSGAGFGLIFWLSLGLGPNGQAFAILGSLAGLGLASIGLAASLFHLGHTERAWRALSQWRSSWLSREGVLAIAALLVFALYAGFWVLTGTRSLLLGLPAAACAAATI